MIIRDWILEAVDQFKQMPAGLISPTNYVMEAELLLGHATSHSRSSIAASRQEFLKPEEIVRAHSLLARRTQGEPLAYILGYREFMGRRFEVNPSVLIPRTETEIVCLHALEFAQKTSAQTALDIGTGSGCIAITLKLELPDLTVSATDISIEALTVAQKNADDLGAAVDLNHANLFPDPHSKYDLIVSNPPYIGESEELTSEVREYEPSVALFADDGGHAIYKRIIQECGHRLNPGGHLILEIGDGRLEYLRQIAEEHSWNVSEIRDDLDGNPRSMALVPTKTGLSSPDQ